MSQTRIFTEPYAGAPYGGLGGAQAGYARAPYGQPDTAPQSPGPRGSAPVAALTDAVRDFDWNPVARDAIALGLLGLVLPGVGIRAGLTLGAARGVLTSLINPRQR